MRLDVALAQRGLARSRNQAARLIGEGRVQVDGVVATKPSQPVEATTVIVADTEIWVSRAAYKLLGALDASGTAVPARVLDAGASTGGFTQVCLARGAARVYAVDVGHDQLVPELRADPRVSAHDGLNLRDLSLEHLDSQPVELVVADISFISLRLLLEPILKVCADTALLLVKPQFEVGAEALGTGGVVRDPALRAGAVGSVIDEAERHGWCCDWQAPSTLPGTHGNVEHFIRLVPRARRGASSGTT